MSEAVDIAARDAPLLISGDDKWHSFRCSKVRTSEIADANADVAGREHCPACRLFDRQGEAAE